MDELEQAARRNAEKSIAESLILFIFWKNRTLMSFYIIPIVQI